jgi:hypothetical protein
LPSFSRASVSDQKISRAEELAVRRSAQSNDYAELEVEERRAGQLFAARGLVVKKVDAAELFVVAFWYFCLTIQNTAIRQVRNLFCLLAVFISLPLARATAAVAAAYFCCSCCAPPPHPAPLFGGREVSKKRKSPVASGMAFGLVFVGVGVLEIAVQCKHFTSEV